MRWYVKTAPKIGDGSENFPYQPDMTAYPTAQSWAIVMERENDYVIKVYM